MHDSEEKKSLTTVQSILWMLEQVKDRGEFHYRDWVGEFRPEGPYESPRKDRKFMKHLEVFRDEALPLLLGNRDMRLKADHGRYFVDRAVSQQEWERINDPQFMNFLPLLRALGAQTGLVPFPAPKIEEGLLDTFEVDPKSLDRILYKSTFRWRLNPEFIETFIKAIQFGKKVSIVPEKPRSPGLVTPLYLINFEGAWHLLAYRPDPRHRRELEQYNLSRVVSLTVSDNAAAKIPLAKWKTVKALAQKTFGIGLVTDWATLDPGYEATVRYRGQALRYARERYDRRYRQESDPWFRVDDQPGWIDVTVRVHDHYEIVSEALRWGADAEVLSPEAVRSAWLKRIEGLSTFLPGPEAPESR